MLKKFKLWVYRFVSKAITEDTQFIRVLYDCLEEEKRYREQLKDEARKLRFEEEQRKIARQREEYEKQKKNSCSHTKGGNSQKGRRIDYAIWDHTFPDGSRSVQCLICNKEWKGEELKSPEVLNMLNCTTNTKTASEVLYTRTTRAVYYDYLPTSKNDDEEWANNPLYPLMSRGWLKIWANRLKKIARRKNKLSATN